MVVPLVVPLVQPCTMVVPLRMNAMGLKIFHDLLYPNNTGVPQWKGDSETGSWNERSFKESFEFHFSIFRSLIDFMIILVSQT